MAQVTTVEVPDIGDFEDVPVVEVLVEVGQTVAEEDPLVALESDKATMEVPSTAAGTVAKVLVEVGDTVSQGTPVVELEGGDTDEEDDESQADVDPDEQADDKADTDDDEDDTDDDEAPVEEDEGDAPQAEADGDEATDDAGGATKGDDSYATDGAPKTQTAEAASQAPVYASPSARKLAREEGVDLSRVEGSGRGGRITLEDVQRGEQQAEADTSEPAAAAPADAGGDSERQELTRIQRISGPRLQQAWQEIPHVTQHDEADITDLEAFRKATNAEQDEVKVTMVALLMKAVVASLKAYPRVNSSLDTQTTSSSGTGGDADAILLHKRCHLGFAADTPNGLLVPVIKDAQDKGILALAAELRELSGKARDGKLSSGEMQGATFTISSLGGIGGTAFTPIVNQPQVAILGVSRSATKPVWDGEQFVPRLLLPLSFSYDHRVIDGALAARFTTHLSSVLADLRKVLL